ncbi:MAG: elongation factor P [Chlamydiae bacterium SM23_39]|nr:MAG: elongation factor P [Chlamydiae bacterium SM23_39]
MVTSNQLTAGMTISIGKKIYRVESSMLVKVTKGAPFIKTSLRELIKDKVIEKNFKLDQEIKEVTLEEKNLEFLYLEDKKLVFLDIDELEMVYVDSSILSDKINYLKEGVIVKAKFYDKNVYSIELPLFLEFMVVKTEPVSEKVSVSHATKKAILETGAEIYVPLFVEAGDIIKIDTRKYEYIQRI